MKASCSLKAFKLAVSGISICLFSACATSSNARFQDRIENWKGRKSSDLVGKFGQPLEVITLANGNFVYNYHVQGTSWVKTKAVEKQFSGYSYQNSNGYTQVQWCEVNYIVDNRTLLILDFNWRGNDCKAY